MRVWNRFWSAQTPVMKRVFIGLAFLTVFLIVHGTWTFRINHQRAFAQAVEKRIAIETVHVQASHGVLILSGHASQEQSLYAETIAKMFIDRFAARAINPPREVLNQIQIDRPVPSVTRLMNIRSRERLKIATVKAKRHSSPELHSIIESAGSRTPASLTRSACGQNRRSWCSNSTQISNKKKQRSTLSMS